MRITGGGEQPGHFYNEEWSILCCSSGEIVDTTLQAGDYILDNNLYHKIVSLKYNYLWAFQKTFVYLTKNPGENIIFNFLLLSIWRLPIPSFSFYEKKRK